MYNEQLSVSGLGYGIDNRGSFATRSCCILAKKTKHISRFAWYRLQINKKGAIYLTIGNARQLIMRQYIEALNNLARVGIVNEKNPRNLITVLLTTL